MLSSNLVYCKQLEARSTKFKCWALLYNHACLVQLICFNLCFLLRCKLCSQSLKTDYSYYLCIQRGIQKSEIIKVWWHKNTEEAFHLLIPILTNSLNLPSVTIKVMQLFLYPISFVRKKSSEQFGTTSSNWQLLLKEDLSQLLQATEEVHQHLTDKNEALACRIVGCSSFHLLFKNVKFTHRLTKPMQNT